MKQYRKIGVIALLAALLTMLCGCSAADFTLPSRVDMQPGETLALTDLVRYNGADLDSVTTEDVAEILAATEQLDNIQFNFASTVPGVVSVDETGVMTAGVTGEATVVISCVALDYYAETQVTVCTLPQTLTVEPAVQLMADDTYRIKANVDKGPQNVQLLYTGSDDSVVTVDVNGVVTAVGAGTADVTVTVAGSSLTGVCRVTVAEADTVQSVTISRAAAELAPGDTLRLAAEICISPAMAETAKADTTWQSSDEAVAAVNGNGIVTATGEGTAIIRVTAGDKTAACSLTVSAPGVATSETAAETATAETSTTPATAETAAEEEPKMEKTSANSIATPENATPETAATSVTPPERTPDTMPFGHGPVVPQNKTAAPGISADKIEPGVEASATPESATVTETLDMDVFFETPETATPETATSETAAPETATPETAAITKQTVRDTLAEVADAVGELFDSLFGRKEN